MDDITLNLIVAAVLVAAGVVIFLVLRRRGAQRTARRLAEAAARGWQVTRIREGRTEGYRFAGLAHGRAWTVDALVTTAPVEPNSGSGAGVSRHTTWRGEGAVLGNSLAMIGPRSSGGPAIDTALGGLQGMLVRKALGLMLGADAELFAGMAEVPLAQSPLQARYMAWAHDAQTARRLLSPAVEQALLAWPARWPLVVKLGPSGMQIDVEGAQLLEPDSVGQLADLGMHLLDNWQSTAGA